MSLSTSWNNGFFNKLIGLFKGPRDPVSKNLRDAIYILDKMANFIDSTKKNLQEKYEEHQRRAKLFASEGKKEYEQIYLEESKHISTLISLFTKVYFDLIRVRNRLETIMLVEEPMALLPEIAHELDAIKPEIERLAPELAMMLYEVKRRINSIMSASRIDAILGIEQSTPNPASQSKDLLPPLPPREPPVKTSRQSEVDRQSINIPVNKPAMNINEVKKLILDEIKRTGNIFVISDFAKKYGLPTQVVKDALKKLEEEGLIKTVT